MSYTRNRGTVFFFSGTFGGVTQNKHNNFYTSWTDLIADIAGVEGQKTIQFDNSNGLLEIPAGAYDLDDIILSGGEQVLLAGDAARGFPLLPGGAGAVGITRVVLEDGVTFTNLTHITNGIALVSFSADTPVVTLISADSQGISNVVIENGSSVGVAPQSPDTGSAGFFSVGGTSPVTLNIYLHNGGLLDEQSNGGSSPALVVDAFTATAIVNIFASGQSVIDPDVLTDSASGGTIEVTDIDGAPTISTDQSGGTADPGLPGGVLTVINNVDADSIAYDVATSGLTGENVQDAIDDLALRPSATEIGVTTVSTNLTLGVADGPLIDVTAGSITITLPAVAFAAVGKIYHIKDADGLAAATNITIEGDGGSETIDGETTFVLVTNFQGITVVNLGDKWTVI